MKNVLILLISVVIFTLSSCKSSTNNKTHCQVNDGEITCNGGYSYWINDIAVVSNGVVAISGVKDHKRSSQQWVSFFSEGLTTKLAEIPFARNYYADEHNAPAILGNDDGSWLIVRTGHNDTFEQGQGKLYVYSVDDKFKISHEVKLFTENGATYAQLVKANNNIYLLTRDSHKGWGFFVSEDDGISWGNWQSLWIEQGHRYISMQGFGLDNYGNDQLIFNIGHHPTDVNQKIGYLVAKTTSQGMGLMSGADLQLNHAKTSADVEVSFSQQGDSASNIRFLDASNKNGNVCHLYSQLNSDNNQWQLFVTGHNLAQDKKYSCNQL